MRFWPYLTAPRPAYPPKPLAGTPGVDRPSRITAAVRRGGDSRASSSPALPPSAPRRPRGGENSVVLHQTKGGMVFAALVLPLSPAASGELEQPRSQAGLRQQRLPGRQDLAGPAREGSPLPGVPRRKLLWRPSPWHPARGGRWAWEPR